MVEGKQEKTHSKQEKQHEKGVFDNAFNALTKLRSEFTTTSHHSTHEHSKETAAAKGLLPSLHIDDLASKTSGVFHSAKSNTDAHHGNLASKSHTKEGKSQAHVGENLAKGAEQIRKGESSSTNVHLIHGHIDELALKTNQAFHAAKVNANQHKTDLTPVVLNQVQSNPEFSLSGQLTASTLNLGNERSDLENFDRMMLQQSMKLNSLEPAPAKPPVPYYEDKADSLLKYVGKKWDYVESEVRGTVYAASGSADRAVAKLDQALGYYNVLSPASRQELLTNYEFSKNNFQSAVGVGLGGCRFLGGLGGMLVKGSAIVQDEYESREVKQMSGGALSYCVPGLRQFVAMNSAITKRLLVPAAEGTSKTYDYYRNNGGFSQLYSDVKTNVSEGSVKMYHHWMNASPMERGVIAGKDLFPNVFILRDAAKLVEVGFKKLPSLLKSGKGMGAAEVELSGAVKVEGVKPEVVKPEAVKPEAVKPEAVKPEAVKPEAVKAEAAKPEAVKPEAVKPELVKPEAVKPEAPKSEESRIATKPEAGNPEVSKPSAPKTEAPKGDDVRGGENQNGNRSKPEARKKETDQKSDSKREESKRNDEESAGQKDKNGNQVASKSESDPVKTWEKLEKDLVKATRDIYFKPECKSFVNDMKTISRFIGGENKVLQLEFVANLKQKISGSSFAEIMEAVKDPEKLKAYSVQVHRLVAEIDAYEKDTNCVRSPLFDVVERFDSHNKISALRKSIADIGEELSTSGPVRQLRIVNNANMAHDFYGALSEILGNDSFEVIRGLLDSINLPLNRKLLQKVVGSDLTNMLSKIRSRFDATWADATAVDIKTLDVSSEADRIPLISIRRGKFSESPELPEIPTSMKSRALNDFMKIVGKAKNFCGDLYELENGNYLARRFDLGNKNFNVKGYLQIFDSSGSPISPEIHSIWAREGELMKPVDIKLKPRTDLAIPLEPGAELTEETIKAVKRYLGIDASTADGIKQLEAYALSELQKYGFDNYEQILEWSRKCLVKRRVAAH